AGTALAGFWLIGDVGIGRSIQLAAATNVLIGLIAFGLDRRIRSGPAAEASAEAPDSLTGFSERARRTALVAFGLSGLCSFAYAVVWTRMLALVLDTSIYAFVTMLAMVLVGLAAGSALASAFVRRSWNWLLIFALLEALVAAGALWAIWSVANLPEAQAALAGMRGLRKLVSTATWFNFVVAALAILPATLAIGATFPVAARIYTVTARPAQR